MSQPQHYQFQHGERTISYELVYSRRRKTIGIKVHRTLQVTVRAPQGTPLDQIETTLQDKAAWILKHLQKFEANPPPAPRRYTPGERHWYLGEPYMLFLVKDGREGVALDGNQLVLSVRDPGDVQRKAQVLKKWQRVQAKRVFYQRLDVCYPLVESLDIPFPKIYIREMKTRWGSCSGVAERINLNLRLIQVPLDLIDYVIVHELCHFKEHNHSPRYYALLARVMPDWEARRQRLNQLVVH